jgi:hypothetical protein
MLGQEYSPDETAILGVRSGTDTIFNITNRGLLKPKKYGLGNFVADSTGRTESGFAVIVATDGTFIEKPISSFAGVTTNIYTDNGTLEEDRTITGAGHYLWATGLSSWIFSAQAVGSGWVNSNRVIGGVSSISSLKAGSTVQVAADSVSARIRYSVGGVERSIEIEQDTMFITPETMDSIAVGEVLTVTSIAGGRAAIKTRPVSTTDLHLGNSDLTLTGNRTLDGGGNSLTLDVSGFSVLSDGIWSSSFSGADYYLSLSEGISSVWTRDTNQTESISVEENLIGFDHRYFGMVGVFRMRNDSIWLSRIKAGTSSSEVSRIDMLDRAIKLKAIDASDAVNEIIIDSIAINFSKYGLGNMVKDSLSKTESDYLAGFATDGTVIELDRKTVPYHEITSTSSPQTFSSTKAVNFVNQGSTQTTFTFKMPANPVDGQELYIHWGNVVSTVTLDGNGKTIKGTAVTTATEGSERAFRFFSGCDCWLKRY